MLESHGYSCEVPPETTDRVALKGALEALKGKNQIVKPLEKAAQNGYAVATIIKGTVQNDYPHDYAVKCKDGWVDVVNGSPDREVIQETFNACKAMVPSSAISTAMKAIIKRMNAVVLYPGTYWLPPDARAFWEPLAKDVVGVMGEDKESNKVRMLTTKMDAYTLTEVRDALVAEVKATLKEIQDDVATGTLGEEALVNRRNQATALHSRIGQYEGILDAALDDLHATVAETEKAAMLANLQVIGVG